VTPRRKKRGPNGSVRGLVKTAADQLLQRVVRQLEREGDGRRFQIGRALGLVQEAGVKDERLLEGFRFAITGMPGVRPGKRRGEFVLPALNPAAHARYRTWRMALGRVDLADAQQLTTALRKIPESKRTPRLTALLRRLEGGTGPLLSEE